MTPNVISRHLDIAAKDGLCDCFVAYPEGSAVPGVLLLMDAFGPRAYLYEMAQTLASQGHYVLLPNIFYRHTRAPVLKMKFPLRPDDMDEARSVIVPLARGYDPEAGLADMAHLLNFLKKQKEVSGNGIGVTGYCMGGSLALRTAARFPDDVAAVASFHAGGLATDALNSPHLLLGRIRAEIYVAHADHDPGMPPEQIEKFGQALEKAALENKKPGTDRAELYQGALHGFTMADLPAGNAQALTRHWNELFALFQRTLAD